MSKNTRYTVSEAATILERDPSRIRQILIAHPELGQKHGRDWMITAANLKGIRKLLKNPGSHAGVND